MPSPAIFVSAGLGPSSSGPLNRSSARAWPTQVKLKLKTDIPALASNLRIRSSPLHSWGTAQQNSLTRQTRVAGFGFSCGTCGTAAEGPNDNAEAQSTLRFAEKSAGLNAKATEVGAQRAQRCLFPETCS